MTIKLIDLTIEELEKMCDTIHNCPECPCSVYGSFNEECWKSMVENGIKNIEVEVLDNDK